MTTAATHASLTNTVSTTFGVFSATASSDGSGPAGTLNTDASQNSFTPNTTGLSMYGSGSSTATVSATGFTGFSVLADSFFDVFFEVDLGGHHSLTGSVNWTGDFPPFGGYATIELINTNSGAVLVAITNSATAQGTTLLSASPLLATGIVYRLHAQSLINGGFATAGLYSGAASWDFNLTAIPEPSAMLLTVIGILALAGTSRWCRRSDT